MTGAGNADDQASDSDSGGGWDDALADLAARKAAARSMGGAERLAKHRSAGKLDVRARVAHLLDPGSFLELGTLVGGDEAPADAIVMGSGRIDPRDTRNVLLHSLERALHRRQAASEPVARIGITP